MKFEWQTGEMNDLINDVATELKSYERNILQTIEDERHSLHKRKNVCIERELDLQQKISRLSSGDINKK